MDERFRKKKLGIWGVITAVIGWLLAELVSVWLDASPRNEAYMLSALFAVTFCALVVTFAKSSKGKE